MGDQLIKTIHVKDFNGKSLKHHLIEILKDDESSEKRFEIFEKPSIDYYVDIGAENRTDEEIKAEPHYVKYKPLTEVRKCTADFNSLYKEMAYEVGRQKDYKLWKANNIPVKKIMSDPCIHSSDIDLEDFYIAEFYNGHPFKDTKVKLTKSFFDIEVDSFYIEGFPEAEDASCPINAISFFNDSNMTLYGLFLNIDNNDLVKELRGKKKEFVERIINKYKEKYNLDIDVKLKWFNDELKLIESFFNLLHYFKPDFIGAWNLTSYDIKYIRNRLLRLTGDEAYTKNIMCDPDIPYQVVDLFEDNKNQDFSEKSSNFVCSDYTVWLDQLLLFASLRKSEGKRDSYSLDAIANEEIGENKVTFSNPDVTVKNAPYIAYEEFIEYNLHDTMLLYMIEARNNDFDMIYTISAITQTRIEKALKKTVSVRNLARKFYIDNGYVMSNNHNVNYLGETVSVKQEIRGAFVADPNLNSNVGISMNSYRSKFIFNNAIDFDLESLYPSLIMAFNLDTTTQIGEIHPIDNNTRLPHIMNDLFEDYISRDYISFAHKYLNLPNVEDMLNLLNNKEREKKENG